MGSLKRKIERKKSLKKAKVAKKNLKKALSATMGMPTNCTDCGCDFDPEKDSDTWMVTAFDDVINLRCPECYKKSMADE